MSVFLTTVGGGYAIGPPEQMPDLPAALAEYGERVKDNYYPSWENVVWQVWEDFDQEFGLGRIVYDEATDKPVFLRA